MQTDTLAVDRIQTALSPEARGALAAIHVFPALDSTNRWALQHAQCAEVCLAEQQTAGRGRRGRQWQSPAGVNVYLSLRWCFTSVPQQLPLLSLVTGIAVAEALAMCGVQGHGLKWPNDIVFSSPLAGETSLKKLGGILLEAVGSLQQVVIGIGLNVNMLPDANTTGIDQPWTSLRSLQGKRVERNTLAAALLSRLVEHLQAFPNLDNAQFQQAWQDWDVLAQRTVRVLAGSEVWEGLADGVDSQGQLRLQLTNGLSKVFSSADVSVRM